MFQCHSHISTICTWTAALATQRRHPTPSHLVVLLLNCVAALLAQRHMATWHQHYVAWPVHAHHAAALVVTCLRCSAGALLLRLLLLRLLLLLSLLGRLLLLLLWW